MTLDQRSGVRVDRRVVGGFAAFGLLAGIAAKVGDESGWSWAGDLGSYPAAWVLAVALIGRAAPAWRTAAVRAAVFFAAMTVAYYAYAAWVLGFGWNRLLPVWLLLSATAVACAAVAAWWGTRRPGPLPGALMAAAAGIVLAGRGAGIQLVVDVVVAVVLVLLLPRHGSTRVWALVLTLPMAWLGGRGLDLLAAVVS
ncbi:hypothetical protein E4P40_05645 [Blastococcus sp. CT_GayMR20]|uniref:hypothetical protein n=1 Tax=Blastococcus sp. CT_GayMR20 TaxID=2559609 RepID=UPI001073D82F|nr:hypothetical protein [Blastococcus sp. CT_GayMR20]TFV91639.1 hypothetical protein E4P40_05645 [Blastococcus sp. CT_GayMR20]